MTTPAPHAPRRLFTALLGLTIIRDLLSIHVPLTLFPKDGDFVMPWFEWLPLPTASLFTTLFAHICLVAMAVAAVRMVASAHVRWSPVLLLFFYGWAFASDQRDYTSNQYLLLLALGLVAIWRPTGIGLDWGRLTGRVLISSVYLAALSAKLDAAWLSGFVFDESVRHYGTLWPRLLDDPSPALSQTLAVGTMAVEAALLVGLWIPRLRRGAMVLGVAFHIGIELLLPVRTFSYVMVAGYVLFLSPGQAQALCHRIEGRGPLVGLAAALGIAIAFNVLGVYPLPLEALALVTVGALLGLVSSRRSPSPTQPFSGWPPRLAAATAGVWLLIHGALLAKPLLGGDDRFAFRMFRQVLIVGADTRVKLEGRWMKFPMHGATAYWPEGKAKYYWESWAEHQRFLQAYAEWAHVQGGAEATRVVARFRVNGGPTQVMVFTPGEPPSPLSTAPAAAGSSETAPTGP